MSFGGRHRGAPSRGGRCPGRGSGPGGRLRRTFGAFDNAQTAESAADVIVEAALTPDTDVPLANLRGRRRLRWPVTQRPRWLASSRRYFHLADPTWSGTGVPRQLTSSPNHEIEPRTTSTGPIVSSRGIDDRPLPAPFARSDRRCQLRARHRGVLAPDVSIDPNYDHCGVHARRRKPIWSARDKSRMLLM